MQNKITIGLSKSLGALGTKYKVYSSKVKQNLTPPCFLIHTVSSPASIGIAKRKELITMVSITYYPETEDEDELRSMINETTSLYDLIEVSPGKYLRGYHQEFHISDGCLVCTVEYKTQTVTANDTDMMEALLKKGAVK